MADVQMGWAFRARLEHNPQGDVAVIQMKDVDEANLLDLRYAFRITLPHGKTHHLLRAGDLVFRSRGRSNGAAQVCDGMAPAVLAAPMLRLRPHAVLPEYLGWYLNTPTTQAHLAALAEGTSVRMISAEALKALDVPMPSLDAQHRIVYAASLAEQEHALLTRSTTLRQRLADHLLMKFAHEAAR